jgi:hypothetical protein
MNPDIFVLIVCFISLIVGGFIGIKLFKSHDKKKNIELVKNAKEVLEGNRKNTIIIDGQEYDATRFILRDKEDNEKLIDLKGGTIQDGPREISSAESKIEGEGVKINEEAGGSSREKKRTSRIRSVISRIRRFG